MAAKMAALQRRLSNAGLASKDTQLVPGAEGSGEVAGIGLASQGFSIRLKQTDGFFG